MNEDPLPILTPLLSVRDAAKQTGLPLSTIYDAIAKGTLPALRFGKRIRIKPAAVQAWIDAHETRAEQSLYVDV